MYEAVHGMNSVMEIAAALAWMLGEICMDGHMYVPI